MIAKLIDLCIRNRVLVLILAAFVVAAGVWSVFHIKLDAIPDLSDTQVIVYTEYTGQAPKIVEDQVTYPLANAMLGVPQSKVVRGLSMFGVSFIYVIFEDGTDLNWARSRVLERLSFVLGKLPAGVTPQLGPDATGVGWVYEYALTTGKFSPDHPNGLWHDPQADKWYADPADAPEQPDVQRRLVHHRVFDQATTVSPLDGKPLLESRQTLANLRSLQDWYLRYELAGVPGVSEVASVGGFEKQYQILVDPVRLLSFNLPLSAVKMAVEKSNQNVGGRVVEWSEREYAVEGIGYLGTLSDAEIAAAQAAGKSLDEVRTEKVLADLRSIALGATPEGSPLYLRDVADVRLGPEMRRGAIDWNGQGEAVGGVVVMRSGENARSTIDLVRQRLATAERGLPPGVAVEVAYDRSDLIDRSIHTLSRTLLEEILVVSLVVIIFLLHLRSSLVAVIVLPLGVLASLAAMNALGINANIMSLGGIAIAIGVMVDSSIIMVENAHKHMEWDKDRCARGEPSRPRAEIISEAAREVGPSLFFALLVIVVSFLPIFVLGEQSGRLFKPLAYTKTFAMAAGAILAVTVIPVLMVYFVSEQVIPITLSRWKRWIVYLTVIFGVAAVLAVAPLAALTPYRPWVVAAWIVLTAVLILPQRLRSERRNPLSRLLEAAYDPAFKLVMRLKWLTLAVAAAVIAWVMLFVGAAAFTDFFTERAPWVFHVVPSLGSEFMPPLEEGDLLYMPTTDPGISLTKARELLQQTDRLIRTCPEVENVMGKIGRAETATDPAPVSMFETTITLSRDKTKWRRVPVDRFYSGWPDWAFRQFEKLWPSTRPITVKELIEGYKLPGGVLVPGLDDTVQIPGLHNSWTMPIQTRIDMLTTGFKTPIGIKVMGPDLAVLSRLAEQIIGVIKTDERTGPHTTSVYGDQPLGVSYLDIQIDRAAIARYGLSVADVQDAIATAIGGQTITTTVEGRQRYSVNLRYASELRDSLDHIRQVLVTTPAQAQIPLGQLATLEIKSGSDMIRSENARTSSWVYVVVTGIDLGTYVHDAQKAVESKVKLPQGYSLVWSGQFEYMQEANQRLLVAVPLAALLIILLLYVWARSWLKVGIVLLAVFFSLLGAVGLLWILGYHLSLAVWVGMIALAGLDAETGMVMLLYLDNSFDRFRREGRLRDANDLWHAVHDGAVKRIRPKTMTVLVAFTGLVPLMWADGAGADTMRRLAAPMIGGLATSFVMELLIYPVIFYATKRLTVLRSSCP